MMSKGIITFHNKMTCLVTLLLTQAEDSLTAFKLALVSKSAPVYSAIKQMVRKLTGWFVISCRAMCHQLVIRVGLVYATGQYHVIDSLAHMLRCHAICRQRTSLYGMACIPDFFFHIFNRTFKMLKHQESENCRENCNFF